MSILLKHPLLGAAGASLLRGAYGGQNLQADHGDQPKDRERGGHTLSPWNNHFLEFMGRLS